MSHPLLKRMTFPSNLYTIIMWMSAAALLACAMTTYSYKWQEEAAIKRMSDQYGNRIAKVSADQMAASLSSNDAISLQAIAHSIVNNASVISVITYDINNSIVAQANGDDLNILQHEIQLYASSIVSSNDLIGSVTVGIAPSRLYSPTKNHLILVFVCLLITIMLMSYVKASIEKKNAKKDAKKGTSNPSEYVDETHTTNNTPLHTMVNARDENEITEYFPTIYLTLLIQNSEALYQQLNAEMRIKQLNLLEKNILQAIALYNGKIILTSERSITLAFEESQADNIFQALYSGELVCKLNQAEADSIIILSGLIQLEKTDTPLCEALHHVRMDNTHSKQHCLYITQPLIQRYTLGDHIDLQHQTSSSKAVKINSLKGNYKTLLDNQLQQLLKK